MQLILIEFAIFSVIFLTRYRLIYLKSPVYLRLSVILVAICTSLNLWYTFSKWTAFALRLIFVGGIMIIFLYVSSLSANRKTLKSKSFFWGTLLIFILIFNVRLVTQSFSKLGMFYSWNSSFLLTFLILYLLLTLLLVSKFSRSFKGPLTEKFF